MRNIILFIFIVCNAIAIIYTTSHPLTIDYFSLRVMFVALSLVLTILFILLKTTRVSLILSLISLTLVFIHIAFIAHSTYTYLFN
ncbi:glucan phosphoethanolaminetransferase (alkaline phosphatase superfamily) [Staphylococcus hominis]